MEWYKVMQSIGDKHAVKIRRSYLDRVRKTDSATAWTEVENSISQGAVAVYYSIQWSKWQPAKQVAPAYIEMYNRSISYLQKYVVSKEAVSLIIDDNSFTMPNPAAENWLLDFAGTEITALSQQDLKMVRAVLAEGQAKKWTYKETAKVLRQVIGLNEPQYRAWQKYTDNLQVPASRRAELSERYYNKLLKYRAETIGLTESHKATGKAWTNAVDKYVQDGTLSKDKYEYYWLTAPDERMCDICGGMSGETTDLTSRSFPGGEFPPIHPRCRCTAIVKRKN